MGLRGFELPGTRRRAINLRLRPGLQFKLPLIVVAISGAFAALFAIHTDIAYGAFLEIGFDQPGLRQFVTTQAHDFRVVSLAIGIAYVVFVLVACLAYAHRLLGPIVAIRRHLEGMKNGDYTSRLSLRAGDAFTEVADDLNEIAGILQRQSKHTR